MAVEGPGEHLAAAKGRLEPAGKASPIISELESAVGFQRKWRQITSWSYFLLATFSVMFAAAATVVAGLGYSAAAAICAAITTVVTSLEKVLQFREKWVHHRACETQLDMVRLRLRVGRIDEGTALSEIERIMTTYVSELPIGRMGEA
jgi:hypothetical protein